MTEYRGSVAPSAGVAPNGEASKITVVDAANNFTGIEVETILAEIADEEVAVRILVHNDSGADMANCVPVYFTGFNTGSDAPTVALADADDSAKMPAVALLDDAIADGATGKVVTQGFHKGIDTSSYSIGDALCVSTTVGELTNVRPTGATDGIQNVAFVSKVGGPGEGWITVVGAGRTNDVPNLTTNKYWEGNGSNQAAEVTADDVVANVTASGAAGLVVGATLTTNKLWAGVAGVAAEVDVHDLTSHVVNVQLFDAATTITTGDGAAFWAVPDYMASHDITGIYATTADAGGTSSLTTIQVHNLVLAADLLSTALTIDNGEQGSHTADTPLVINTANDHLSVGDYLRFDIDTVAGGTAPKGLWITLEIK